MIWKLIIWLLRCKDSDYIKSIKIGKQTYIIKIKKFVPVEEQMEKWKDALAGTRTSD